MTWLPDLLHASAQRHPEVVAIAGEPSLTYRAFDALVDRIAAGLAARGVRAGERIGLYCLNSAAFAATYFGILRAGGTVVPINLLLNPKEIAYILADAGAGGLIYHEAFAAAVSALREAVPDLRLLVRIGGEASPAETAWTALTVHEGVPPSVACDPAQAVAALLYTSGTTGFPKGAMLTHRNLAANVASSREVFRPEPGRDAMLVVLPMFHAFAGTVGMLLPLLSGSTLVPVPRFDPALVAQVVERFKVTVMPLVPSMIGALLRLPDAEVPRFASVRYCISGGAALPQEIMERFEAKFGTLVYEGDGPTECGPVTCVNPIGGLRKPRSVGPAIPGVAMRILDDRGEAMPHGEIGEICVRGANVMQGYWNRPAETAQAFVDEWFRTGDLGTQDDDGYFYIVDRKKDMIIVNGMNVYPRMIEEILHRHPAVLEATVIGEPHEAHGEIPVAYLAVREGSTTDSAQLRAWCLDHLGRHQVPRKFFIIPALPRNAAGKVLKRELRKHGELERGIDSRSPG